jgi:hypothetical protein
MKVIHQQQQEQPVTDANITNNDNDVSPSTPINKVATAYIIPLEPLGVLRNGDNNTSSSSNVPIGAAESTNEADIKYSNELPLSKAQQEKREEQQQPNTNIIQHRVPDFSPMVIMKSHSSDTAHDNNNSRITSITSNKLPKQVKDSNSICQFSSRYCSV